MSIETFKFIKSGKLVHAVKYSTDTYDDVVGLFGTTGKLGGFFVSLEKGGAGNFNAVLNIYAENSATLIDIARKGDYLLRDGNAVYIFPPDVFTKFYKAI